MNPYPNELIAEVRELYPDSLDMIELAESGSWMLGRYLDDSSMSEMPMVRILSATSLGELQKEAHLAIRKCELYDKWCDLYKLKQQKEDVATWNLYE